MLEAILAVHQYFSVLQNKFALFLSLDFGVLAFILNSCRNAEKVSIKGEVPQEGQRYKLIFSTLIIIVRLKAAGGTKSCKLYWGQFHSKS